MKQFTDFGPRDTGQLAGEQTKWGMPLEWLSDRYPEEHEFCLKYNIDNDQVQDQHQPQMIEDGFFESDEQCYFCDEMLNPKEFIWIYISQDETEMRPMHKECARDLHWDYVEATGTGMTAIVKWAAEKTGLDPYKLASWVIAYGVDEPTLTRIATLFVFRDLVKQGEPPC